MSALVPFEHLGRARALRTRCARAWARVEPEQARLLAPMRPRPGFSPMPSHAYLRGVARAWRRLPPLGRLRLSCTAEGGALRIVELPVVPMRIAAPGWDEDEPAIGVGLVTVEVRPPRLTELGVVLAAVGLHALARRYERGPRDDAAVLADLVALARDVVSGENLDLTVPTAGGGRWVCRRRADNSLIVRSFLAEGQVAGSAPGPAVRARVVGR